MIRFLIFLTMLLSFPSSLDAAEVKGAWLNLATQAIDVDVVYGGGCKEHVFTLQFGACLESYPVRCSADLVDLTKDDFCEALIGKTVSFPLAQYGLLDEYFRGATISIRGDRNSSAFVVLPR